MTVAKRRNKIWFFRRVVRLPDGTRRRVFGVPTAYGLSNTKVAAEEAERRAVQALLSGQLIITREYTLAQFAPVFLEASALKNKHSSMRAKRQIIRDHLLPRLGTRKLTEIDFAAIEDLKLAVAATRSAKTVNNVLTVLRALLAVAHKRELIHAVPQVEWLHAEKPGFDFLTFDELDRVLAAAAPEWAPMIEIASKTGMRQGELLGLRWEDVDLVARRIMVRQTRVRGIVTTPKSRKSRAIELGDDAIRTLKAIRHLRGPYVFCDDGGAPLTDGACKWPLWMACKRAGVREIGWHVLRHTYASHLVMQGAPITWVQAAMGHATLGMTLRYAHLAPESLQTAARLLDRANRGAISVPRSDVTDGIRRDHEGS